MKVDVLRPRVKTKIEFSLSTLKFIPQTCGCYVLTNYFEDILYIGLSKNVSARVRQHLDSDSKNALTELGKVYFVHYLLISNEIELNKLERGWLNAYELETGKLPPLNSIHSPI